MTSDIIGCVLLFVSVLLLMNSWRFHNRPTLGATASLVFTLTLAGAVGALIKGFFSDGWLLLAETLGVTVAALVACWFVSRRRGRPEPTRPLTAGAPDTRRDRGTTPPRGPAEAPGRRAA